MQVVSFLQNLHISTASPSFRLCSTDMGIFSWDRQKRILPQNISSICTYSLYTPNAFAQKITNSCNVVYIRETVVVRNNEGVFIWLTVVDTEDMVMEGLATHTGVEGGDSIPSASDMLGHSLRYMFRGDFVPIIAKYHEWQENIIWWNDYAKNTGVSLQDIPYPYKSGYYHQTYPSFANPWSVSKNVLRLYK